MRFVARLPALALAAFAAFAAFADERPAAAGEAALWAALRTGGHLALVRHAEAPGGGDPPGFRIGDCTTQRNLSAAGREQARAIGERMRRNGLAGDTVLSSPWCRCLETARLLDVGEVVAEPLLGSMFGAGADAPRRIAEQRRLLAEVAASGRSRVLVTHHANIGALTGAYPGSGEIVVVRIERGAPQLVGRLN